MFRPWIKILLPPIILKLIRFDYRYGWHGNYPNWETAMKKSSGYDHPAILEKIKTAVVLVKEGKAVFERDGVLFPTIPCSLPVLSALRWSAALTHQQLLVTDIGGSLGTGYRQHTHFLKDIPKITWNIIEQPHFVSTGNTLLADKQLAFFTSLEESISASQPGIALFSTSLQYFEKPYAMLRQVADKSFDFILIDRIAFSPSGKDRLTIQVVPPLYYTAKYPCWFLSRENIKQCLSEKFECVAEYSTDESHTLGFNTFTYQGLLFKRKSI